MMLTCARTEALSAGVCSIGTVWDAAERGFAICRHRPPHFTFSPIAAPDGAEPKHGTIGVDASEFDGVTAPDDVRIRSMLKRDHARCLTSRERLAGSTSFTAARSVPSHRQSGITQLTRHIEWAVCGSRFSQPVAASFRGSLNLGIDCCIALADDPDPICEHLPAFRSAVHRHLDP